jgi:hypothetical protein
VPSGQPGNALVSDLAVNDYLPGQRAKITAISGTTNRTLTLERRGFTYQVTWVGASSVVAIRP